MCKQPIRIRNNSKYLNNKHGQQYYIWINCGHCSECRKAKQAEWNLRTFYEANSTIKRGGWLYFDTLTYNNNTLPRLNKLMYDADGNTITKNYPCFKYEDIRNFYESLRQLLKLKEDKQLRYFVTCEYGELRKRPHMHIILFVNVDGLDVLTLSALVAKAWNKGRTDGIGYKSRRYVMEHNYIDKVNLDCIRYVAKYVSKAQTYEEIIAKRWQSMEYYYKHYKHYDKLKLKKLYQDYKRHTTPFHRQSQGFGIDALNYFDINKLIQNPQMFYKDDSIKINQYCGIPKYYQRHLFEQQIKYKGKRIWIKNELGIKFKETQETKLIDKIADRYQDAAATQGKKLKREKAEELARYTLLERGRLQGKEDYQPHHKEAEYFNYSTNRDEKHLGKKCISSNYAGNDAIGYETTDIEPIFIENLVQSNKEYDALINELIKDNPNDKKLVLLKEHLNEVKKVYFNR